MNGGGEGEKGKVETEEEEGAGEVGGEVWRRGCAAGSEVRELERIVKECGALGETLGA